MIIFVLELENVEKYRQKHNYFILGPWIFKIVWIHTETCNQINIKDPNTN